MDYELVCRSINKIRKYKLSLLMLICNFYSYIFFKLYKIHTGHKNKFWGIPNIYRSFHSSIVIGSSCRFRSDKKSNLIGINRKCIIATLKENAEISIGDRCGFSGTVIASAEKISIGNKVLCGANTLITDYDWHHTEILSRHQAGNAKSAPILIEDNVWLGINVIVLKGVKIGKNSVIGAGSVVVKDIPENVIAAGNPCRVIKLLN